MMKEESKTETINETPALRRLELNVWAGLSANKSTVGALALLLGSGLTALAAGTDNRAPEVPDDIAVTGPNKVHFHGFGVGVQIYTWNGVSWGGPTPRATLFDDDGNIVAGSREREECVRGCTFQNDAWLDVRDIARCIEPSARCVIPPQQQQRFVGEFGKLQFPAACKTVSRRNDGKHKDWRKQPPVIGIISGCHESEVNIAAFEAIRNAGAAIFDQIDIHRGVSAPKGR